MCPTNCKGVLWRELSSEDYSQTGSQQERREPIQMSNRLRGLGVKLILSRPALAHSSLSFLTDLSSVYLTLIALQQRPHSWVTHFNCSLAFFFSRRNIQCTVILFLKCVFCKYVSVILFGTNRISRRIHLNHNILLSATHLWQHNIAYTKVSVMNPERSSLVSNLGTRMLLKLVHKTFYNLYCLR